MVRVAGATMLLPVSGDKIKARLSDSPNGSKEV